MNKFSALIVAAVFEASQVSGNTINCTEKPQSIWSRSKNSTFAAQLNNIVYGPINIYTVENTHENLVSRKSHEPTYNIILTPQRVHFKVMFIRLNYFCLETLIFVIL